MEYSAMVQSVLDEIDRRIGEPIRTDELARTAGYSRFHFCRVFERMTGTPVLAYVTRRKLEYALFDLSQGRRIVDVAMDYGFETHTGFTKAFKKCYGVPPSLYRLHIGATPPERVRADNMGSIKLFYGGSHMQVQIREQEEITVVGYASRHSLPGVNGISDIPAFWDQKNMEYGAALSTLHHTYPKSRHCEVSVCLDVDEEHELFTYLLGVGVDKAEQDIPLRPGAYMQTVGGGLYAVFTTPPVKEAQYSASIPELWRQALGEYLPASDYEFDPNRLAFEYYDERDHAWLHDGMSCMDVCVPVKKRR